MFPKNKTLIILIVMSLYVTSVFLANSDDLLSQIQKIRYENQIQKIEFSQTITFSSEEWQAFSNKTEIKHNNTYYDVISFQKFHSKVVAKVIKDDFENEFRLLISQIFNKHKTPSSEKKINFLSKHIVQKNKMNFNFKTNFKIESIDNHNTHFDLRTRSFIDSLFEPPC